MTFLATSRKVIVADLSGHYPQISDQPEGFVLPSNNTKNPPAFATGGSFLIGSAF
jgi:hypothetical protein